MSIYSEQDLEGFRQTFDELDINGDERLTRDEVGQILSKEGEQYEQLMVVLLFEKFDTDNSGTIDFDEFLNFCSHINSRDPDYLLHEIFVICDKDGNGHLDLDEVARLAQLMGIEVTKQDAIATLHALDANHDETVDFNEFLQLIHGAENA